MALREPVAVEKMVFRKTNGRVGRHLAITPENSTMRHLCYARVILNSSEASVSFSSADRETILICLRGNARVRVVGDTFELAQFDSIYIPRNSVIEVSTKISVDLAEFSASVSGEYPLKVVRYSDIANDPALKLVAGNPGSRREVSILMAKNVEAGRLIAGFTCSDPGNWTSWPPHEHAKMLEELYVYFDMPDPAFGIQLVYNDKEYPELITAVRDGDAVLVPSGYHPNVAVPGHRIAYLWAMAAHREVEDRHFGVFNIQPEFLQGSPAPQVARK